MTAEHGARQAQVGELPPVGTSGVLPAERLVAPRVPVPGPVQRRLAEVCDRVDLTPEDRAQAGRDWWPLAVRWAVQGVVPALPDVVVRPRTVEEVAGVLAVCHDARVPLTPAGGRSGVCGGAVPVFGGVALDLLGLAGLTDLDDTSLLAEVAAGTSGPDLVDQLSAHHLVLGHWPQSLAISTVGGWAACRGAGQASTRYGTFADLVRGATVVLADGRITRLGGHGPRAALGPDLLQVFLGSEGTLGVITSLQLQLRPEPPAEARRAYQFPSFAAGLEACRLALRAGATPAVLRLYDPLESARHFGSDPGRTGQVGTGQVGVGRSCLIALDEATEELVTASSALLDQAARAAGGEPGDPSWVEHWLASRNDVSALVPLVQAGLVVDTIEVAAPWALLPELYRAATAAVTEIPGTLACSAHQSHAYPDGACLYFTFAGRPPDPLPEDPQVWAETYYQRCWEAVMAETARLGGALSHHHGVGLQRQAFLAGAPGVDLELLQALKGALDPRGICNPGKLGLPSPFGEVAWPPGRSPDLPWHPPAPRRPA